MEKVHLKLNQQSQLECLIHSKTICRHDDIVLIWLVPYEEKEQRRFREPPLALRSYKQPHTKIYDLSRNNHEEVLY